jgi:hypothetical protein
MTIYYYKAMTNIEYNTIISIAECIVFAEEPSHPKIML